MINLWWVISSLAHVPINSTRSESAYKWTHIQFLTAGWLILNNENIHPTPAYMNRTRCCPITACLHINKHNKPKREEIPWPVALPRGKHDRMWWGYFRTGTVSSRLSSGVTGSGRWLGVLQGSIHGKTGLSSVSHTTEHLHTPFNTVGNAG